MVNYYLLLTKPGIILGNLITVMAGFLLASKGFFDLKLFLATLLGISLVMASACVFNNYIDRKRDQKMERTKKRALVVGNISVKKALLFASALGLLGFFSLYYYVNFLTLAAASLGFFTYVILYSFWKSYTIYGTAIGSVAGAIPPVIGYLAVRNQLDLGAILLFIIMILWQMPHFFAIAILHLEDYKKANIPTLPLVKGIFLTKIRISLYIAAFTIAATLLTFFQYTGYSYLIVTLILSFIWFNLSLQGFQNISDKLFAQQIFRFSLILITLICLIIPFDTI